MICVRLRVQSMSSTGKFIFFVYTFPFLVCQKGGAISFHFFWCQSNSFVRCLSSTFGTPFSDNVVIKYLLINAVFYAPKFVFSFCVRPQLSRDHFWAHTFLLFYRQGSHEFFFYHDKYNIEITLGQQKCFAVFSKPVPGSVRLHCVILATQLSSSTVGCAANLSLTAWQPPKR